MTKLDEVMMDKTLSNVSKMIYSYMCVATGEEDVVLTRDGFERMYASVVMDTDMSANECFEEMCSAGLLKPVSSQDDGVIVYGLIR